MRLLATLLNFALLGLGVYVLFDHGLKSDQGLWFVLLLLATPTTSLIALRLGGAQDWLSLFLQRKALEEKTKIEQLGRKQ